VKNINHIDLNIYDKNYFIDPVRRRSSYLYNGWCSTWRRGDGVRQDPKLNPFFYFFYNKCKNISKVAEP